MSLSASRHPLPRFRSRRTTGRRPWKPGMKATPIQNYPNMPSAREQLLFEVLHDANRVTLKSADIEICFSVEGVALPQILDATFAVWILLPLAMAKGKDLHIVGGVDPEVIGNAIRLAKIWEMWVPEKYLAVNVTCSEPWEPTNAARTRALHLFSGGIDSTFSLLQLGRHAHDVGHVLTVQGLDYAFENAEGFQGLISKTDPLLKSLNYDRVIIRTDVALAIKNLALTHGFILAGSAFLLRQLFADAVIAADYTWEQDLVVFPWGTNHVTNRYFRGSDFSLQTSSAQTSRSEKAGLIAQSTLACSSLSFCGWCDFRLHNCGTCSQVHPHQVHVHRKRRLLSGHFCGGLLGRGAP